MMHLKRKLRGSRLPQERWWAPPSHSAWECTRCHTTSQLIYHFHNKDPLATRTCSCHHSTIISLITFQLTVCTSQILIHSQILCRMTLSVDYRGLISVATDHLPWSLKTLQTLQVKVAPHSDSKLAPELLTCWPAHGTPSGRLFINWHEII